MPASLATLRDPQPGDLGWVVQQHGEIYAREYGWNQQFEGLVAGIVAGYVKHHKPGLEKCWVAELDGERAGSVFVVRKSPRVAQLRLLILASHARGHGLGSRLTEEAMRFARSAGYHRMVLWTHSCLLEARRIYHQRGFELVSSEPYQAFGQDLVSEHWELDLRQPVPVRRQTRVLNSAS
jgi:GNAT superfamily N-acetyltransferase